VEDRSRGERGNPESWDSEDFERLFESAPDAAIVVDRAGRILRINAAAEDLFGYPRGELLGQSIELLVPERFRAAHVIQREEYVGQPRRRPMGHPGLDLRARRKDGSEFRAEIALGPLETDAGLLVTAIIRDVAQHHPGSADEHAVRHRVEEYAAIIRNSLTHMDTPMRRPPEPTRTDED
jgi:PAS domain S-box-containing protein